MNEHSFVLILSGIGELTPELADALFEATNGDLELNMRKGVAYAEVTRSASTLARAVMSAIEEVEGCGHGIRVVRVESEAANTIAQINAQLLPRKPCWKSSTSGRRYTKG